jgi:hypothetical protein
VPPTSVLDQSGLGWCLFAYHYFGAGEWAAIQAVLDPMLLLSWLFVLIEVFSPISSDLAGNSVVRNMSGAIGAGDFHQFEKARYSNLLHSWVWFRGSGGGVYHLARCRCHGDQPRALSRWRRGRKRIEASNITASGENRDSDFALTTTVVFSLRLCQPAEVSGSSLSANQLYRLAIFTAFKVSALGQERMAAAMKHRPQ